MSVQPFKIEIPQAKLDDLQRRLANTFWPDEIDQAGWDYGTNLAFIKELCRYWRESFDWREQERRLNRFAHFTTNLDGLDIHFIHERGKGPKPLPIVLTHGWPDSFYRFVKIIPLLTDPAAYGGDPADAFDVVVPSMPGFGFSGHATKPGMTARRMAELWLQLMTGELGYERFGAHGGDVGGGVTVQLALLDPDRLAGIHVDRVPLRFLAQKVVGLTADEQAYIESIGAWQRAEGGYSAIQGTKPQTLSYGLADSPVGLAAWITEKFRAWSDCSGDITSRFTNDELLTNIMIYWVTNSIASANRYYYEAAHDTSPVPSGSAADKIQVPTGMAVFPKDLLPVPRSLGERFFNLQRFTEMPRGGHFAALEVPEMLVEDIRAFFRPLR